MLWLKGWTSWWSLWLHFWWHKQYAFYHSIICADSNHIMCTDSKVVNGILFMSSIAAYASKVRTGLWHQVSNTAMHRKQNTQTTMVWKNITSYIMWHKGWYTIRCNIQLVASTALPVLGKQYFSFQLKTPHCLSFKQERSFDNRYRRHWTAQHW